MAAGTNMSRFDEQELIDAIGGLEQFAHQCHACSLQLIRTGLLPKSARVARGWHVEIQSQHSWVAIGNPYDPNTTIIDGTLWSYTTGDPFLHVGPSRDYKAHGAGLIGPFRAPEPKNKVLTPKGASKLSPAATRWLKMIAPKGMDVVGWMKLVNGPMGGWPSDEIIPVLADDNQFNGLIPIDIVGMLTDKNPGNLYF